MIGEFEITRFCGVRVESNPATLNNPQITPSALIVDHRTN